jgi:hypothetical protein
MSALVNKVRSTRRHIKVTLEEFPLHKNLISIFHSVRGSDQELIRANCQNFLSDSYAVMKLRNKISFKSTLLMQEITCFFFYKRHSQMEVDRADSYKAPLLIIQESLWYVIRLSYASMLKVWTRRMNYLIIYRERERERERHLQPRDVNTGHKQINIAPVPIINLWSISQLCVFCDLFSDTLSVSDYKAGNGRMTDEQWTGKNVEGGGSTIICIIPSFWCRGSSVCIATSYGLEDRGSITDKDKYFLLSTASRPVLGSILLSVQCVAGAISPRMKLSIHLHPLPRSRTVNLYLNSSICLHDIVLN